MPDRDSRSLPRTLIATLLVAVVALAGCKNNPNRDLENPDDAYRMAKDDMSKNNYARAVFIFEQMEARFPFANATKQSQLDLMYAYYKNREPESATDQADQFIRENPTHPRTDYAYYIKGLVAFERNPNVIERWFRADLSERPPIDATKSYQAFATLVQRFPNSEYAADARQRMIFLRNRLANYETYVANYYLTRGAYAGAINRAKFAIENYDGAPAVRDALIIMSEAYKGLGMADLAADADKVLRENFAATANEQSAVKSSWWKFW
jgi:outer membrane protein assembly factor BamD